MHEGDSTVARDAPEADVPGGDFTSELLRANQLYTFGRFERVDRALASAARLAARDEDHALAVASQASVRYWHLADLDGAHRVLDEATARLGDVAAVEDLVAQRAVLWLFSGRTARALVACLGLKRRHRGSDRAVLLGAAVEAMARGLRGEVELLDPLPARRPAGELDELAVGFNALTVTFAHVINGAVLGADGTPPGLDPSHRAEMLDSSEGSTLILDGISCLSAGRPRSAAAVLEEAATHLRRSDRGHLLPTALGALAYCHALVGDAEAAHRAAEGAAGVRHGLARFGDGFLDRGRAWADAARGEVSAARDRLAAGAAACTGRGQPVIAAQLWHDVARLGDPARSAPPLTRLAAAAPPRGLIRLLADHVAVLAAGDAAALGEVARRLRDRGHLLHAAEAAAQTAALHRSRRVEAERWRQLAASLAARCEGARTPALGPLHDLDLTPREREIVGLAAQGLTNPDIARRLHVSVRTVGNHLQASYVKLGVHRREELAGLHLFGVET